MQLTSQSNFQQNQFLNINKQQTQFYLTKIIPKINPIPLNNNHNYNQLQKTKNIFQITPNPDGNVNIQLQYLTKQSKQESINQNINKKCFTFTDVLNSDVKNSQIFDKYVKDLVKSAFQGKNGCVIAYGQTGSGKSSLIYKKSKSQQKQQKKSLLQYSIQQIENIYKKLPTEEKEKVNINLSCIELYNEKIIDLMSETLQTQHKQVFCPIKTNLRIKQNKTEGVYIQNLTVTVINKETIQLNANKYNLKALIQKYFGDSIRRKQINQTKMSQISSRSSLIYNIQISYQLNQHTNKIGKLTFVDLPGSEKINKTGSNLYMNETANIGKCLGTFLRVMEAISSQNKFVPYRDSILTRTLQNQLKGSCKNIIFFCLISDSKYQEESLSTLRAANHLKKQNVIKIYPNYLPKKQEKSYISEKKNIQIQ